MYSSVPFSDRTLATMTETQLQNPPTDGITAVHFSPNNQSQFLIASSWDSSVRYVEIVSLNEFHSDASIRLYDVHQNACRQMYKHSGPVLDCCFPVSDTALC